MNKDRNKTEDRKVQLVSQRGNYHDYFARSAIRDLRIMKDILRHYIDKAISRLIDPERLQLMTTSLITKDLKEIMLDQAFVAQFRDEIANSDLFIAVEHKSSPNHFVVLQLGTQVFVSLYSLWTKANYTGAKSFKLPVPIMVVLYNGADDWDTQELRFQDVFEYIPKELRDHVPQFRVLIINLKQFEYGKLPGCQETRAVIESLKRATDGTFAKNLKKIVKLLSRLPLDQRIQDLARSIIVYAGWSGGATKEQLEEAALAVWKGQEGIEMSGTIQKSFVQECLEQGLEQGLERGLVIGKVEAILTILKTRFNRIPSEIKKSLNKMADPVALDSLVAHAAGCKSIKDFTESL